MFDPDLFRTLVAVAETGSFTRAARRVHLTQATVSQQVRRMEEQVGRVLFTRTTHAVALTTDGEIMLGYARAILRTADDARRHFARRQLAATVRLGVSEDYALCCLPRALEAFQRVHPQVQVHVELGLSTDLFQRLGDGNFDLVLAKTLVRRGHGQFVLREPLVWVGAADRRPLPPRSRCRWRSTHRRASPARWCWRRWSASAGPGAWPTPARASRPCVRLCWQEWRCRRFPAG